jgi:protein-L-isoaspartate(D-aspartate) O-methyltransferase
VAVKDVGEARVGKERLRDVLRATPVDRFVPEGEPEPDERRVMATLEGLELTGEENVLEIGTGFGWQTALLAQLARRVWSIERRYDRVEAAAAALAGSGMRSVRVISGDGSRGLPGRAPYHTIVVTPAFPNVPSALARQLVRGGRLVQPIGGELVLFERGAGGLERVRTLG